MKRERCDDDDDNGVVHSHKVERKTVRTSSLHLLQGAEAVEEAGLPIPTSPQLPLLEEEGEEAAS